MHPRERDIGTETTFRVNLPENPQSPFDDVVGVVTADTNHLARFSLCGKVNQELIDIEREATIDALDDINGEEVESNPEIPSEFQNIGRKLDIAEGIFHRDRDELCEFLSDRLGVGVISSDGSQWLGSANQAYPYLFHYDFSDDDIEVSSIEELENELSPRKFQIRINNGMKLGQEPTLLHEGSGIISGRGRDIIQTPLGRLPIGFTSVHLGDKGEG